MVTIEPITRAEPSGAGRGSTVAAQIFGTQMVRCNDKHVRGKNNHAWALVGRPAWAAG